MQKDPSADKEGDNSASQEEAKLEKGSEEEEDAADQGAAAKVCYSCHVYTCCCSCFCLMHSR